MNSTVQDEITAYVEAVRAALSGLPTDVRDELLEDLPEHLAEIAAEGDLVATLGAPDVYAAELLAAAGYVGGFPDPPGPADRLARLRADVIRQWGVADARIGPVLGYERASEFLILLRPAWWVLRGYVAAMVVAWALDDSGQPMGLVPRIGGSEVVAVILLAAGILASIWLGRRSGTRLAPWPRYALYAGTTVLVLVAIGGFLDIDSTSRGDGYTDVNYGNGDPYANIQDVFVYDSQGHLVTGARLLDQAGQPIILGWPQCFDRNLGLDTDPVVTDGTYPRCPANAPFRLGPVIPPSASADPSAAPTPSDAPSASAPASPSPGPSRSR